MRHAWGRYQVVLTSASPRRKELLTQIGLELEVRPSRMEEETRGKKPDMVAMKLSRQKTEDVALGCPVGTMVIGADIMISVGSEILRKPEAPMRAYEMLEKTQSRTRQVYTGVTVLLCQEKDRCHGVTFTERTGVHVYPMTYGEMKEYARCGELLDRAGAYRIQDRFTAYIRGIDRDYANVVGLPVEHPYQEIGRLLEDGEDD